MNTNTTSRKVTGGQPNRENACWRGRPTLTRHLRRIINEVNVTLSTGDLVRLLKDEAVRTTYGAVRSALLRRPQEFVQVELSTGGLGFRKRAIADARVAHAVNR